MRGQGSAKVERMLARLAGRAHGVVTRAQLLDAGISSAQIERRLKSGLLLREHRGVYRVGHRAPSVHARYMAAVLACGDEAMLSGLAAAHLLGIVKGKAPPPEVTTPTYLKVEGVRTRRGTSKERTVWYGIPVTSPAQTIVDRAPYLLIDDLARMCHEAEVRHHA